MRIAVKLQEFVTQIISILYTGGYMDRHKDRQADSRMPPKTFVSQVYKKDFAYEDIACYHGNFQ